MKKILLSALIASATAFSVAEQKTATFDFSNPATYGYEAPANDKDYTALKPGDKMESNGVTITNMNSKESATAVRFWNSTGTITFRLASGGNLDIAAGSNKVVSVSITGTNITPDTNFSSTPATTWKYDSASKTATWTGNADKLNIVRTEGTVQMSTMTVVYEISEGGNTGGGDDNKGSVEQYVASSFSGLSPEFANATVSDGLSTIEFGTEHVQAIAVGGATPKDVQETEAGVFPGWSEWNDITWSSKERSLNDAKTMSFYYIEGKGNPFTALEAEAITTEGEPTGKWKGKYTLYVADGSNGLPISGLYYKFTPSVDGKLRMKIWSNKGNRNTFVVDNDTKLPIEYAAEGYINGQNEPDPDNEGKNKMKYLSDEEIKAIHHRTKTSYTYDTIWTDDTKLEVKELIKKDSVDTAPYVIANGLQPFFGWVVIEVKAGKTYWLFQDSSQIGFGGFDFAYGGAELPDFEKSEETAIEEVATVNCKQVIFDLNGRRVSKMQSGHLYIQNGKKVFVR